MFACAQFRVCARAHVCECSLTDFVKCAREYSRVRMPVSLKHVHAYARVCTRMHAYARVCMRA